MFFLLDPTQPLFARRKIQIQITVFLLLLLSFCNSIAIHSINTIWLPIMGTQSSFAFPASCLIWWSLLPVFWFIRFCRSFLLFIGLVRAFLDLLLHDFCSDLSGKISECVVWVVEAVAVLLHDLVISTPDSESWIWFLLFQWLLRAVFISAIMGQCVLSSLEIISLGSIFHFLLSGLLCFLLVPILIEFVFFRLMHFYWNWRS